MVPGTPLAKRTSAFTMSPGAGVSASPRSPLAERVTEERRDAGNLANEKAAWPMV